MDFSYRYGYAPSSPPSPTHLADPSGSAHAAGAMPADQMEIPTPELRLGQAARGTGHGVPHPGAPHLDMSSDMAQPGAEEALALRERICPPDNREDLALDAERIGKNAMISALAQGGCFGLAFSLNNYLRVNGNPVIKQLSGFLSPVLGGFLTSPAETFVRDQVGMQPTALPNGKPAWWHDAIPSVVLLAINKAYAKSKRLPKFGPATPSGMVTTALLSVVGTGLAGALGEAAAQGAGGHQPQRPLDTRATLERGIARATTLVPMGAVNLYAARHLVHKGQMPPNLGLKPLGVGVAGWAGRNKLGAWVSSRFVKPAQPPTPPPVQPLAPSVTPPPLLPTTPSSPQPTNDPPSPTAFPSMW